MCRSQPCILITCRSAPIFFSLLTILLYGVFLAVQTIRNRTFFVEPRAVAATEERDNLRKYDRSSLGKIGRHTLLLVVMILPIVLLAEQLAKLIDHGIAVLKAPPAMGGVLIAALTPSHARAEQSETAASDSADGSALAEGVAYGKHGLADLQSLAGAPVDRR